MDTAIAPDIIDVLSSKAAAGNDVWAEVLSTAENYVDNEDKSLWAIGDLACLVVKRYGENRIQQFAIQVRKSVDTVEERRTVCLTYPKSVRSQFQAENEYLTYSHFRRAIPIVREKSLEEALAFLEQAATNEWSVEETTVQRNKLLGRPVPPARKTWRVPGVVRADFAGALVIPMQQGTFDAANIAQFVNEHRGDKDFEITLTVTYTKGAK